MTDTPDEQQFSGEASVDGAGGDGPARKLGQEQTVADLEQAFGHREIRPGWTRTGMRRTPATRVPPGCWMTGRRG
jgi:hypothetical protein